MSGISTEDEGDRGISFASFSADANKVVRGETTEHFYPSNIELSASKTARLELVGVASSLMGLQEVIWSRLLQNYRYKRVSTAWVGHHEENPDWGRNHFMRKDKQCKTVCQLLVQRNMVTIVVTSDFMLPVMANLEDRVSYFDS